MKHSILFGVLVFCFVTRAVAQSPPDTIENVRAFNFTSSDPSDNFKQERFCLPRDQTLLRIKDVTATQSNDKSNINVWPDLQSNCVMVAVTLAPQQSVCVKIPELTGVQVSHADKCVSVPTTVGFVVKYEAKLAQNAAPQQQVAPQEQPKQ
jgi:hypothetical protein